MSETIAQFTMSLDGFIAGPHDEIDRLFRWYRAGDTDLPVTNTPVNFRVSSVSAALLSEAWGSLGAIVTGRRDFDMSEAWGGTPPLGVPTFIVTHQPPPEWSHAGSPFIFVTEGVEQAIALARQAARDKHVGVGGTRVVQQGLRADLIDRISIDLVPVLLGTGIRLFDQLGPDAIDLDHLRTVEGEGVTHLHYRVVKPASSSR